MQWGVGVGVTLDWGGGAVVGCEIQWGVGVTLDWGGVA